MKKVLAVLCAAAMMLGTAAAFSGCGNASSTGSSSSSSAASDASKADESSADEEATQAEDTDADDDQAGFTEIPIFEDEEVGFMNVAAVYFQAVPMSAGASVEAQKAEDYDIHLEADISAIENKLGYPVGSWVPYLTVEYKVTDKASGETKAEGTFMEMAASDGPHYGSNIKLPDAGDYELTITIKSPAENDYLIHTDSETGPGGTFDDYFKDGPLTITKDWQYAGPVTA